MENNGETVAYRPFLNRDRLIYLTHPELSALRDIGKAFVAQGFEISSVPDVADLDRMSAHRRPDLVIMPMPAGEPRFSELKSMLTALRARHLGIPVFLLAPTDVRAEAVVAAVRCGASEVFSPPYATLEIVRAAEDLFRADLRVGQGHDGSSEVTVRGFGALTPREREVLHFVVAGKTNKEIATELGLSYRTVEVHRRHIMEKIGARNTAELVRLAIGT